MPVVRTNAGSCAGVACCCLHSQSRCGAVGMHSQAASMAAGWGKQPLCYLVGRPGCASHGAWTRVRISRSCVLLTTPPSSRRHLQGGLTAQAGAGCLMHTQLVGPAVMDQLRVAAIPTAHLGSRCSILMFRQAMWGLWVLCCGKPAPQPLSCQGGAPEWVSSVLSTPPASCSMLSLCSGAAGNDAQLATLEDRVTYRWTTARCSKGYANNCVLLHSLLLIPL
jgi:hypothetical protein